MKIAVLGSPTSWYLADLRRAAADRHEVISATFRDLESSIAPQGYDPAFIEEIAEMESPREKGLKVIRYFIFSGLIIFAKTTMQRSL